MAALAQYIAREGHHHEPRGHTERVTVEGAGHGESTSVSVRLGVFMRNTRSRRDKLTEPQRVALAELGIEWA
ncbi:hypothetical protein [Streptomyces sp. NPDC005209]|uniref:hypothetical protein n=1 Tax=Streptomyces sp. NPDC005209 TaxID=3156715 RepID=UPI0033BA8E5D